MGLWGEKVSRTCLGPGSPSPRGPSRRPVALLPSGQACLRPRCYGGCVLVSHQAPGCGRPQPRAGQNPGRLRCPFRQTYPEPAHPTTCFPPWKPTPPAARVVLSPPLISLQPPRCPGTPPAELSLPHLPLPALWPRGAHTSSTGRGESPRQPSLAATGRHLQTSILLLPPCPQASPWKLPRWVSEKCVRHTDVSQKYLVVLP